MLDSSVGVFFHEIYGENEAPKHLDHLFHPTFDRMAFTQKVGMGSDLLQFLYCCVVKIELLLA